MEGAQLTIIDQLEGDGDEAQVKVYALVFFIAFIVLAGTIIFDWVYFLPQMEDATKETERTLGESKDVPQIIQKDAIPQIRLVFILYLICFGLLDSILALMVWKSKVPKNQESAIKALANSYIYVRNFNIFIIIMLSIMALVGSNYGFALNLLYISLVCFSIVSVFYIIYLKKKILIEKLEDPIFKIPEDVIV
jgi:hypothetical protein